jgi:hypothetical protein
MRKEHEGIERTPQKAFSGQFLGLSRLFGLHPFHAKLEIR